MPSSITHAYIAKDIYRELDKKIKGKFKENDLENYKTYAEGPDIYYFYNMTLPITKKSLEIIKFGRYMHGNQVNEIFINLTKRIKKTKNFQQFLFLIGLLTHYIADSTIHPYVDYKASLYTKKHSSLKDNHFMVEAYIDNYMINKHENLDYKKFKVHEFCFNLKENSDVINLINESYKEVFNKDNMGINYYKSLSDMKLFFKLLRYDKTGLKGKFYKIVNPVAKRVFRDVIYLSYNFELNKNTEILNLNHETWYNLKKQEIKNNKSFLDLYDEVIEKSLKIILSLYEYIYEDKIVDLEKLFGNKSYGSGLPLE